MFNTWTWISWLVASLIAVSTTRNPAYLILIFLCISLVNQEQRRKAKLGVDESLRIFPIDPFRLSLFIILISSLVNATLSHFGETVLFYLPIWIPYIGGAITLEAIVYGAINGLILSCIFSAFITINQALPVSNLIRLIPRAFHPVALVTSIAVTFVPVSLRQFNQIREAQAVRGHQVRGLSSWLPLLLPLLIGGLERAFSLAEAMTARGFVSGQPVVSELYTRLALAGGLFFTFAGWLLHLSGRGFVWGSVLMIIGLVAILGTLWIVSRQSLRTTYTRVSWSKRDLFVTGLSMMVAAAFLLPIPGIETNTLRYNPYPSLSLPPFDPLIGILILGLLAPLLNPRPSDQVTQL